MSGYSTTIYVDLDEFSDSDIVNYFMERELYENLSTKQKDKLFDYFGIDEEDEDDDLPETIRDQQYEGVFDQLKEKFSVAELEAIVNSK